MLNSLATDIVAYPSTWLRFLCVLDDVRRMARG
jgi:hypothetical protein